MSTVNCKINRQEVNCEAGTTILEAAREAGIDIPTLCNLKDVNKVGACRICVVKISGMSRLMAACTTIVSEGMEIETENETITASRKRTLDLICKRHRMDCEYCPDYSFCELHDLVRRYGLEERKYSQVYHSRKAAESSPSIIRDSSKCIRCRRCVAVCELQGVKAVSALNRAANTVTGAVVPMAETNCIGCAQCVRSCPTGALFIRDETDLLWRAKNQKKTIIFGIMSDAAANLGCFFGEKEFAGNMKKVAAIARKIGVAAVYNLEHVDLAAVEDAAVQVKAMQKKGLGVSSFLLCIFHPVLQ